METQATSIAVLATSLGVPETILVMAVKSLKTSANSDNKP
jgi:hypothetical protein